MILTDVPPFDTSTVNYFEIVSLNESDNFNVPQIL